MTICAILRAACVVLRYVDPSTERRSLLLGIANEAKRNRRLMDTIVAIGIRSDHNAVDSAKGGDDRFSAMDVPGRGLSVGWGFEVFIRKL